MGAPQPQELSARKFGERVSNEINQSPGPKMFNSFALPVAKPRVSNDKFSSPTKGGKIGISSRLYGDTISSSIKKKGLKNVQFKEEKASTPFVASSFRSNSAVGANRNIGGIEIGAGLMGNKGIPVSSI